MYIIRLRRAKKDREGESEQSVDANVKPDIFLSWKCDAGAPGIAGPE